jgi:signal transduction histidine kinase/CHASE3 domain sensor protein/ActR/RegA family two-component response regulator
VSRKNRLPTERKIQVGFALALACLVLIGWVSYLSVHRLAEDEAWVRHTDEVIGRLQSLLATVTEAETAVRGYVITGDESHLVPYRQSLQALNVNYQSLRRLTADNIQQQRRLGELQPLLTQRTAEFRTLIDLRRMDGFEASQREVVASKSRQQQQAIVGVLEQMKSEESSLLIERERQAARTTLMTQVTILGGGSLGFALVGLSLFAIRRDFAGRYRAEQALQAANEELEFRVGQRTTELEQANHKLKRSERRLRAYVSATSEVIYSMSPDWSEMRQLQGKEFLEDTASPSRDWLEKYIRPEDQERVMQVIKGAIEKRSIFELEHRVRRADGTVGWTFSRAIPIVEESGEISEWFGAASDVTERKESQLKLQAQLTRLDLLSQITRAIGERQDVQSIFQVVIRRLESQLPLDFCCICLFEPQEKHLVVSSVGVRCAPLAMSLALPEHARIDLDANGLSRCVRGQLIHDPDLRNTPFAFAQKLAGGGLGSMVAAPLAVESAVFGVLIAARREQNSFTADDCEFLRQVSENVALATHQAQLHEALQRAYDDLRQTQQAAMQHERLLALGKMASGIAHDINNAITPVSIYTDLLLERASELSPQSRGYLEVIARAIADVAQTVARMREFYRPRQPQERLLAVDLNELVPQVLELTRVRWSDMAQQRGVVIEVGTELSAGLPAVLGVASELRDALTNLVLNAIDAMPEGGELRIATRLAPPGEAAQKPLIQLLVQDTGIGMDAETRRRCLEPFFTTKGERGTGLGLATVYGTLQRHDAEIDIQSAVGQGTTVTLSFPVPAAAVSETAPVDAIGVVSSKRILVIDDDPLILESLRETLEADGHRVSTGDGGRPGLATFMTAETSSERFDAVITDLGMPYVDGRAVSRAVKQVSPNTLVILLTGWGQQIKEGGEVPPHVDAILSKPPKLRELRRALADWFAPGKR